MKRNRGLFPVLILLSMILLSICTGCFDSGDDDKDSSPPDAVYEATSSDVRINTVEFYDSGDNLYRTDTFSYDIDGFITGIISTEANHYMTFQFNADGYLTQSLSSDEADDDESTTYTYEDGKIKTTVVYDEGDSETLTFTYTKWTGNNPTEGIVEIVNTSTLNAVIAVTYNSNGITGFTLTYTGIVTSQGIIEYTGNGSHTDTEKQYNGSMLLTDKVYVCTCDSEGKQTEYSETDYEENGTDIAQEKTVTYTYNDAGNVSRIDIAVQDYDSGIPNGAPTIYYLIVSYEETSCRPAPNDLLLNKGITSITEYNVAWYLY